jgi:hypothetical protein
MSLTKVTYSMISGANVNVLDFGADPTGVADSTSAIQAAINALPTASYAINTVIPGQLQMGSQSALIFPKGLYRISDQLTFGAYTKILSEAGAIIYQTDNTKNILFSESIYQNEINGLTFVGGATQIYAQNGLTGVAGQEGVNLKIVNCTFMVATVFGIQVRPSGAGGGFTALIQNPQMYNCKQSIFVGGIDWTKITDGWIGCYPQAGLTKPWANDTATIVSNGHVTIDNTVFIPGDPDFGLASNTNRWIDFYGGEIVAINCRFGGEYAGLPIVYNFLDILNGSGASTYTYISSAIIIDKSIIPCGAVGRADSGVVVAKTGLPSLIRVVGCSFLAEHAYIRDLVSGGLPSYIVTYQLATTRSKLTIELKNNNFITGGKNNSGPIASTEAASNALAPYTDWSFYTQSYGNFGTEQKIASIGRPYPPTSTQGTTQYYINTGITKNSFYGYGNGGIWDVYLYGNPNLAGTADYAEFVVGTLIITTEDISAQVQQKVNYQDVYNPTSTFTITPYFDISPSGYVTQVPTTNTTAALTFFVAGFTDNTVDPCLLRLIRRT